ncbi:hypothetical protein, partial [Micromonospora globispora]|uniref:hypothetical protein n=1 Tax=Micromonospora globispora TaxID=1450148 RepID=UPI001A9C42EF
PDLLGRLSWRDDADPRPCRPPCATANGRAAEVTGITTNQACGDRSNHQTDMSDGRTDVAEINACGPARRAGGADRHGEARAVRTGPPARRPE